jgi:hypothetical protein
MNHGIRVALVILAIVALGITPVRAADDSKVDAAKKQVETGAKKIGEGFEETAKGIGNTVVEGAKAAGEKLKEAGKAAEPSAKSAWEKVKESAASFGSSVKTFFDKLFNH